MRKLHNPFKLLTRGEWVLWICSLIVVSMGNILSGELSPIPLMATLIGATALVFLARGDVWGQILSVVFSVLYGITAWTCRYWGEMITYLGMTLPMATLAVISWMKNPFSGNDHSEVAIQKLHRRHVIHMVLITTTVTLVLGYILYLLDTPNLGWSILSVTTSFLAAYLTWQRSSWYALAFALNDIVLIILWTLMSMSDLTYLPMVANFLCFFVNDMYGFVSWRKREVKQGISRHRSK